jgi:RNA polymerase primary sigma factor
VYWWIRQAVTRALANDGLIIRLPVHAGELLRAASTAEEHLQAELGVQPSLDQVAARVGVQVERLRVIRRVAAAPGSLDAPLNGDSLLTAGDAVADQMAADPSATATGDDELERTIDGLVEELPERERQVVTLHYGLGHRGALTLAEIGKQLGVTRERARQIEGQALRRLRGDNRLRRAFVELVAD